MNPYKRVNYYLIRINDLMLHAALDRATNCFENFATFLNQEDAVAHAAKWKEDHTFDDVSIWELKAIAYVGYEEKP